MFKKGKRILKKDRSTLNKNHLLFLGFLISCGIMFYLFCTLNYLNKRNNCLNLEYEKLSCNTQELVKDKELEKFNDECKTKTCGSIIKQRDFSNMKKSEMYSYIEDLENASILIDDKESKEYQELNAEIQKAYVAIETGSYKNPYSYEDYLLLSYAVMKEQGDNRSHDDCQSLVACVILNRQKNGGINGNLNNPSVLDILSEKGQYPWGKKLDPKKIDASEITPKCFENTRRVLEGEFTCPSNVLFQATFKQGNGIYKSFENEGYNNTTYFCYGNLAY